MPMSYPQELQLLIDGVWRAGSEGKTEALLNPADNAEIARVPHASTADLDAALQAAARGFETWRAMPAFQRQNILDGAVALLRERAETIALTLTMEQGKPLAEARLEVAGATEVLRFYAEEGKRLYGRQIPSRVPNMRQIVSTTIAADISQLAGRKTGHCDGNAGLSAEGNDLRQADNG